MDQELNDYIGPSVESITSIGNKNEDSPTNTALIFKDNQQELEWEGFGETQLTYTWKQTQSEVIISLKICNVPDILKVLDITFTSKEAHISISGTEKHAIIFHDLIQKEMSKVQMSKGKVTMHVIKQHAYLWPTLEASSSDCVPNGDIDGNGDLKDCKNSQVASISEEALKNGNNGNKGGDESISEKALDKDIFKGKIEIDKIEQRQPEFMDKDEEPVYHLDHMKHDFFQKGSILTLQVFTKCVNKDAVKIAFDSQGFVLKFCTSDQKFLQLHEGTTAETTFSWTVKTRKDILTEECKVKIKPAIIEIQLHTATMERWASLEAPQRKEPEPSKTGSWVPLNGCSPKPTMSTSPLASCSSSKSEPVSHVQPFVVDNKKVMFDEMAEVDVADGERNRRTDVNTEESGLASISDSIKLKSHSSYDWNKPTAKVHPLNKSNEASVSVVSPGYAGLVNFGNTCFMNCVIQVLANTREFRDYFLDGRFEDEINEDNPLGMKGQLASTFGTLLRWLWSCKKYCWEPRKLKDLISKKNPQFFGFAQHDAHEFLAFLLDGLHEDLNRIKQKPYTQTIDSNGRPDEVVAAEAWALYKQRNDSVVVDLFQGQYKSKLVCPKCGKVSITFDPFLYLSVPLPKRKKLIHVTFMWKEAYKKPVKYRIQVCHDSTVERLLDELSQRSGVNAMDIRVFEAYRGRIHKFFLNGASLSYVDDKSFIVACEVLSEERAGEEVIEIPVVQRALSPPDFPTQCAACDKYCNERSSLKRCTNCYKVGYCNHACQRKHWTIHKSQCNTSQQAIGCPFIISLPSSRLTYSNLAKQMEAFSRFSVSLFQPPVKTTESAVVKTPASAASPVPPSTSNLSSALSQSCSSLNSLDSLSSASSTCTLTGDQSDPQIPEEGSEASVSDSDGCSAGLPSLVDATSSMESVSSGAKSSSSDSGFESSSSKSSDKGVPTSKVMGIPVKDADGDVVRSTFLIQQASSEGTSPRGADWLEDEGDTPLGLSGGRFLAMVWRNDEKLPSYVLVQSKDLEADDIDDINNINASTLPTLYQCLELFTEPEILNPEEAWYCPSCKKHVEASKQMAIWKLPHTLVIQLKRFSFQSFLRRSKIEKRVEFPIRGLDLRRYCVGLGPDEPSPVYDLYGVVNHHGHLIGGHYTSFVRCTSNGQSGADLVGWRLCDDSRVTSIDNERYAVTKDAYLLFYRRRGMPAVIDCPVGGRSSNEDSTSIAASIIEPPMTSDMRANVRESQGVSSAQWGDDDDMRNAATSSPTAHANAHTSSDPSSSLSGGRRSTHDTNSNNSPQRQDQCRLSFSSPASSSSSNLQPVHVDDEVSRNRSQEGVEVSSGSRSNLNLDLHPMGRTRRTIGSEKDVNELEEKGDREKDFYNYGCKDVNDLRQSSSEDDDDGEPRLVIHDLGYTDMEAVD